MLYAVAQFGAYVMGSDIDGRQIRGKSRLIDSGFQLPELTTSLEKGKGIKPGILRAAEQYGLQDKFLDFYIFDVTRGPIRRGGWIDAIITDPPCMSYPLFDYPTLMVRAGRWR